MAKFQRNVDKFQNQEGQTIIAIVLLMLISLVIGVTISSRYIKSVRTYVRSDDYSKSLAVAEAATERILLLPKSTLEDYINFNSCGADCALTITQDDGIQVTAAVTLSFLGNSDETFELPIQASATEEVNLDGYTGMGQNLDICWGNDASIYTSYVYDSSGSIKTDTYAYHSINNLYPEEGFSLASSAHGYINCFSILADETPKLLRLKAFYEDTTLYIVPAMGAILPKQGILITSVGAAGDTQKKVKVLLLNPIVPEIFDYALYQFSETEPLSNSSD